MVEDKSVLLKSTTFYGLLLGIFWVIKYIFFIAGSWYSGVGIIYWVLAPLTLVFAFYITRAYQIVIGGKISFFHAWQFGVLLYFFAALIVSLVHYAFYRYWAPPGFMAGSMDQAIAIIKSMDMNEQMKEAVDQLTIPSPIQMTIQGIMNNIFYGVVFSIPVAALISRKDIDIRELFTRNNQEEEDK